MARKGGLFGKNKGGKNSNDENYDVMNPEATNPNAKKAVKQVANLVKNAAKAAAKLIKNIISLLLKIPYVNIIVIILIIILIIVAIVVAFQHMPGMMRDNLLDLFKIDVSNWFVSGAVSRLNENDYKDIIDVANYIEEMGYNLIGDGFVTPVIDNSERKIKTVSEIIGENPNYEYRADENGVLHIYDGENIASSITTFYDYLGQEVSNETGKPLESAETYVDAYGIIRKTDETNENGIGKVAEITEENKKNYSLIRTYLLSNYRIYTLKNTDDTILKKIYDAIKTITGNDDAWAKGLIKLYSTADIYPDQSGNQVRRVTRWICSKCLNRLG